uniref:Membrane-associated kinase regulator 2 n=1 Tax=Davidia involucrata TaxID=16924 RepID=A0A5B6Z8W2_DAVIN
MDAFSLLKFWRNAGAEATASSGGGDFASNIATTSAGSTPNDVRHQAVETDDETDESFFDLEFMAPDRDEKEENKDEDPYNDLAKKDGETRFNFVESPNDVFFNGRIVPLEPSSKPQSPISLLRSAPKFRVFMLGLRKSKSQKTETTDVSMATPKRHSQKPSQQEQSKRFRVKCKVEDVPIASLFTRDNSLRSKLAKQSSNNSSSDDSSKRFPKDVVQKYLKLIKPLYFRVSKRYSDKMKFSDQLSYATPLSSPATAPVCSPKNQADEKQGSRPAALRVVCKHLGKSRSASSTVGIMPSPASRRDDSLLLQHDGIQSAILHCKRSFNSSRESSVLSRSASDPFNEKSMNPPRNSSEEAKRSSI